MSKPIDLSFVTFVVMMNPDTADGPALDVTRACVEGQNQAASTVLSWHYPEGKADIETRWTAFVDAGDTIHPCYVKWLRQYQAEWGCVIFRRRTWSPALYKHVTLPDRDLPSLEPGQVGTSFAVRTAVIDEYDLRFPHFGGDFAADYLRQLREHDIRLYIHPETAITGRPGPSEPARETT